MASHLAAGQRTRRSDPVNYTMLAVYDAAVRETVTIPDLLLIENIRDVDIKVVSVAGAAATQGEFKAEATVVAANRVTFKVMALRKAQLAARLGDHAVHTHTISGSGAAQGAYAQANTLGLSADADAASLTTGSAARVGITGVQNIAAAQAHAAAAGAISTASTWEEITNNTDLTFATGLQVVFSFVAEGIAG